MIHIEYNVSHLLVLRMDRTMCAHTLIEQTIEKIEVNILKFIYVYLNQQIYIHDNRRRSMHTSAPNSSNSGLVIHKLRMESIEATIAPPA